MKYLLFIWIPKTAGTSVYTALKEKRGIQLYLDNFREFDNIGSASFGHLCPKALLKSNIISQKYWQEAQKFVIVRNPYDRFVSLWKDHKRSSRIFPDTTLRQFAFSCLNLDNKPGLYNTLHYSQCAAQVEWILPGVEILRFEDMPDNLKSIGLDSIPHENKGSDGDYLKEYDVETIELVTKLYREDFATLNYETL